MIYARLDASNAFLDLVDLDAQTYAALQANGKAARLRLWVDAPPPVPAANEAVVRGPVVVTPTSASYSWSLRPYTAAEIAANAEAAERTQLRALIIALADSVANPDVSGTAAERIVKLEVRTRRVERVCVHLLRSLP